MGVVYLAEDSTLCRNVALKVVHPTLTGHRHFLTNFRGEAQLLASISHPNVVRIHTLDIIGEQILIDMEYCDGGSLVEVIAAGPLDATRLGRMSLQIAGALAACHGAGLVHRDIKPANILFDSRMQARLADFGLAAAYTDSLEHAIRIGGSTGMLWGTPRYAPPEAWDGAPPTPSWDIFSLGVVIYEAATCRHPFESKSPLTLLKRMNQSDYIPLGTAAPNSPQWLACLVAEMLAPDPAKRPADGSALLKRMPAGLADVPMPSNPTSKRSRLRRFGRRWHWKWAAYVAGSLLFVAALVSIPVLFRFPTPLRKQSQEFTQALPESTSLRDLWKRPESGHLAFSANPLTPDSMEPTQWLMRRLESGAWEATVAGQYTLARFVLRPDQGNALGLEGDWALHPKSDPLFLDLGTVVGTAVWLEPQRKLLAQLRFRSNVDGGTWAASVLAEAREITDTAFILNIESEPLLQPLLFNELLGMNLSWAKATVDLFPAMVDGDARATLVDVPFELDGLLAEQIWSQPDQEKLPAHPYREGATLTFCQTENSLVLGIRSNALKHPDARIQVIVSRRLIVPTTESPRLEVRVSEAGITKCLEWRGGEALESQEDWAAAVNRIEGSAEIRVPFEEAVDTRSRTWRINLGIWRGNALAPVVIWGYPQLEETEHGLLVAIQGE